MRIVPPILGWLSAKPFFTLAIKLRLNSRASRVDGCRVSLQVECQILRAGDRPDSEDIRKIHSAASSSPAK